MKSIMTKLISIVITVATVFWTMPLQAAIEVTERQYSSNGYIQSATTIQTGAVTEEGESSTSQTSTIYDSLGRAIGGTDESGKSFFITYDDYGNRASYTFWSDGSGSTEAGYYTVQYARVADASGNLVGTVGITLSGMEVMSQEDFKAALNEFLEDANTSVNTLLSNTTSKTVSYSYSTEDEDGDGEADGWSKKADDDDTTASTALTTADVKIKSFSYFNGRMVGISGSAAAITTLFTEKGWNNYCAASMQLYNENAEAIADAQEDALQEVAQNEAEAAAEAAAEATASANAGTGQTYTETAESEEYSFTKTTIKNMNDMLTAWDMMLAHPNATVSITLGSYGELESVSVSVPGGEQYTYTPTTKTETITVQEEASASCKATASSDPLVSGTISSTELTVINGHYYAAVTASTIDMHDGAEPVKSDGETIYIDLGTDADSAQATLTDMLSQGSAIAISGDATGTVTDKDGKTFKTMTINDGGYVGGSSAAEAAGNWNTKMKGTSWYSNMMKTMTAFWSTHVVDNFDAGWAALSAAGQSEN